MNNKTTSLSFLPWVTLALAGGMAFVFLLEVRAASVGLLSVFLRDFEFFFPEFLSHPFLQAPTLVSHLFLHGNLGHLISNLIFFFLFAPSVERRVGWFYFLILFFISGAVAALIQAAFSPTALGLIGASGAISGVAGSYLVLHPLKAPHGRALGRLGVSFVAQIPAFVWIGLWFGLQVKGGLLALSPRLSGPFIAPIGYWAHVGGFIVGGLLMTPFVFKKRL